MNGREFAYITANVFFVRIAFKTPRLVET